MSFHRGPGRDIRMDRYGNIEEGVNLGSSTVNDLRLGNNVTNTATANVNQAVALGRNTTASATNSVAIGNLAQATTTDGAVAIGSNALSTGGVSIGLNSDAVTASGTAVGTDAQATASNNSTAIGRAATASGNCDTAVGTFAQATGSFSVAVGGNNFSGGGARSSGTASVAIGADSFASAQRASAIGPAVLASATRAVGIGHGITNAQGDSVLFGTNGNLFGRMEYATATQATNTSGVTVNSCSGRINAAAVWGIGATGSFTVNNNRVAADSAIILCVNQAQTVAPAYGTAMITAQAAGSFQITFVNPDGVNTTTLTPNYTFWVTKPAL